MKQELSLELTTMLALPGYQIFAKIFESANSLVYRGIRESSRQPVIIKILKQDYPAPAELVRYQQEYEITHALNIEGAVKALSLEKFQNTLVIVFEDFRGESLKNWTKQHKLTLREFLAIAIDITETLGNIHSANIIHKDINPYNIVFNPTTGQLKIIDFGIATKTTTVPPALHNPHILEGTLAYMSPEQTGRMNCSLDYRSDFYSLGATFYELLVGAPPFTATDAMELVHCHIAQQPVPPERVNPEIPKAISDIVIKLLAKTSALRYQSAWGIKADLKECLVQLEASGQISDFPLGRQDISDKFKISEKLYGREGEIETLLAAYHRVAAGDRSPERTHERDGPPTSAAAEVKAIAAKSKIEIMLISGYSGIGKSALVKELYKQITQHRGYFITGKFDLSQRNIPYSAIARAFSDLVRQLLTETEAQLSLWREKILAALGVNTKLMIDVIPELELIVGSPPAASGRGVSRNAPTLFGAENRLKLVFQNFVRIFGQPGHPLVLFLDNLQWADAASIKLIQQLASDFNTEDLFLIGAYRGKDLSAVRTLKFMTSEIEDAGGTLDRLSLIGLGLSEVTELIADSFKCDAAIAKPLAKLVKEKTNGNPLFIKEFLQSLYNENLLWFERKKNIWQWDLEKIKAGGLTENVVKLMALKIHLQPVSGQALKLAACLGNQFKLQTLAIVCQKSPSETAAALQEAIAACLVLPLGLDYRAIAPSLSLALGDELPSTKDEEKAIATVEYKFSHDRIQQAAYSLIPDYQKPAVHRKLGKLLLASSSAREREEHIFDIVKQLNLGFELGSFRSSRLARWRGSRRASRTPIPLPGQQQVRDELAALNLMAGKKAKAAAAYEPAFNYLTIAVKMLGEDGWNREYDMTLEVYVEAVESAYLSTQFERMEQLAATVLQKRKKFLDAIKVEEVKIQAYIAQNKLLEAISTALLVLKDLGITFPESPSQFDIWMVLLETKLTLALKQIERLSDLPAMTDPYKKAAMQIMSRVFAAASLAAPNLLPLLLFQKVTLSVQYGNTAVSAHAYAAYGARFCGIAADIDYGDRLGQLALNLVSKGSAQNTKARTLAVVYGAIAPWKQHLNSTLDPLLEAYSSGLETGELEAAAFCAHTYCAHSYFLGKELGQLEREMASYSETIGSLKQAIALYQNELYRQAVLNLLGRSEQPWVLSGESYNEEEMLPQHFSAKDQKTLSHLYLHKLILCYLFEQFSQALDNAIKAAKYIDKTVAGINIALFYFYESLAGIAAYPRASFAAQRRILRQVRDNQKKMAQWAKNAPLNFQHKFYLVEAELQGVIGKNAKAMDWYDRAIELAQESAYINEEALANELAAKFYLGLGKTTIARAYMLNARYCYLKWGAVAKVRDLEDRYPHLLASASSGEHIGSVKNIVTSGNLNSGSSGSALDVATAIKATGAIAGEIELDKLLAKLMKITIENAGAQFGYLILESNGQLSIEAEGAVDRASVTVLQSIPIEERYLGSNADAETDISNPFPGMSTAIVNYVARTKDTVVLNDAASESQFSSDLYIIKHQPKSILCAPLTNQGQLSGIVYLENNLTVGAFTPDRLEVLKLLSSQAAISIDLAKLYSKLRQSEHRLAQFLEAVPVGVFVVDKQGSPYYANQAAQEILGQGILLTNKSESLAEVYQTYLAGTDRIYPSDRQPIVRALKGESATADDIEIRQGDKIIPIEARGTPIFDEKGNVTYAIVALQDITERKNAEAERSEFVRELFELNRSYERFVPRQLLQFLGKDSILDVQLGDQVQQEMSVLFSDIRQFTTLSETMTPAENFKFINSYLSCMEPLIRENHGFIDKYIGDAIMALFSGEADNALQAAIAMLHRLKEYNQGRHRAGYTPIKIGIGINTGSLMLGTVGGYNRMDGTVISDAVNLASRLESLTKKYGVNLLISHQTFAKLGNANQYNIRLIDRVTVKGKSKPVAVFEVFEGDEAELLEGKLVTQTIFEEALFLYYVHNFSEAAQRFQDCLRVNPSDKVAQIYLERCQQHLL